MKTLTPLLIAVMAFSSAYAQTGTQPRPGPSGMASSLSHSDSLVLLEAGTAGYSQPGSRTDTLALTDSLSGADSLLRAHTRVRPFPAVINAVLADFPNELRHITGELLLAQGEFENYASMVELPGAENCTVTRYHSGDPIRPRAGSRQRCTTVMILKQRPMSIMNYTRSCRAVTSKLVDGTHDLPERGMGAG